jgi:hypothetical protein
LLKNHGGIEMIFFQEERNAGDCLMFLTDLSKNFIALRSKYKNFKNVVDDIEGHVGKKILKDIEKKIKNKSRKQ